MISGTALSWKGQTLSTWNKDSSFNPKTSVAPAAGILSMLPDQPTAKMPTAIFPGDSENLYWVSYNGETFIGNEEIKPERLKDWEAAASNGVPSFASVVGTFTDPVNGKTYELDTAALLYKAQHSNNIMQAYYAKFEWYGNVNLWLESGEGEPSTTIGAGVATYIDSGDARSLPDLRLCAFAGHGRHAEPALLRPDLAAQVARDPSGPPRHPALARVEIGECR